MRVVVVCQEEPVWLGPFLRRVLETAEGRVVAVFLAGRRSAGEPRRSLGERLTSVRTLWVLLEPRGFLRTLWRVWRARVLGSRDPTSVEGCARRLGVAIERVDDPNSAACLERLRALAPDIVLNQSERLLGADLLALPRLGVLNRHASLLPDHRGRLASFWAHAAAAPSYGVTIHLVDAGIDTGPIVVQQRYGDVDSRWPYPRVMDRLMRDAAELVWAACDRLQAGAPTRAHTATTPARRFPTLAEAREYRERLGRRRSS